MRQNSFTTNGFTLLEILIAILVIVVVGATGYLAVKHEDNKIAPIVPSYHQTSTTYSYSGYKFPELPQSFTESGKSSSGAFPSVNYSSSSSLSQIEQYLKTVCTNNKYTVEGAFATATNTESGKPSTKSYEMSCDNKNNQWEFNISVGTSKPSAYDVSVMSMPVLTGGPAAAR